MQVKKSSETFKTPFIHTIIWNNKSDLAFSKFDVSLDVPLKPGSIVLSSRLGRQPMKLRTLEEGGGKVLYKGVKRPSFLTCIAKVLKVIHVVCILVKAVSKYPLEFYNHQLSSNSGLNEYLRYHIILKERCSSIRKASVLVSSG